MSNYGTGKKGTINLPRPMPDCVDVIGSRGSAKWSHERVLNLMREGRTGLKPLATHFSLDEIRKDFDLFAKGTGNVIRVLII